MKVYILLITYDNQRSIDLVFSSLDKAKSYIDSFGPRHSERWGQRFYEYVEIYERTVDEEEIVNRHEVYPRFGSE